MLFANSRITNEFLNYMKRFIIKIVNAYWLKEYILLLRNFGINLKSSQQKPMLISIVDDKKNCQGLADRLKGIITIYALSKATNLTFKCIYTHPYKLTDYLLPNQYNWLPSEEELSKSITEVRYKIMRKEPTLKKLLRVFPLKKQVRVYANYDYLDEINQRYKKDFDWGTLFNELFKPSDILKKELEYHLNFIKEGEYVGCTFRFQSLLGDFKDFNSKSLDQEQQEQLIEKNAQALRSLIYTVKCPVLVTSDSITFISYIKGLENVYTIPGKIIHVDYAADERNDVYLKTFVDFFMLSKAKKVYNIGTKMMYPSQFPVYAAKSNNVPFERIVIE